MTGTKSPLGPPDSWPQSLRVTVRLVLNTRHPMFIWWGPELIQFYNDAYRETMGPERHPSALGGRGRECWAEIWDIIGPQIDFVLAGKGSTWDVERLVPVTRHGRREDVWWTYSYSPIDLEGRVGGVLVVCNDVTAQHMAKVALENQAQQLEQAGQQLNLINAELKHRVKNTLTVVSAISSQTFRNLDDMTPLRAFQGRLAAFGRAHDLFIESNWEESSLHDVVDTALAPYRSEDAQLIVYGPAGLDRIEASFVARACAARTRHQRDQIRRALATRRPDRHHMVDRRCQRQAAVYFHLAGKRRPPGVGAGQRKVSARS